MCNLYSMTSNAEAIRRLFCADTAPLGNQPPLPAIFPGHTAPVVRLAATGGREVVPMRWGFILPQKDRAPKAVTNARDNKVIASSFWKPSFHQRRCLVPATSFAEPKGKQPAIWHWFGLNGEGDRPLFAFAGLWTRWRGMFKGEQVDFTVYAILTTDPNDVVSPIHPNRMPVILHEADYETWLNASPEAAHALARPFPAQAMRIVHKGEKQDPGNL